MAPYYCKWILEMLQFLWIKHIDFIYTELEKKNLLQTEVGLRMKH